MEEQIDRIKELTVKEKYLIDQIHKNSLKIEALEKIITNYSTDLNRLNNMLHKNRKELEVYKQQNLDTSNKIEILI